MPGAIVGIMGKQRSGKTLIAYKLCRSIQETCRASGYNLPVYTNLYSPDDNFNYISSLDQFPLDLRPKIFLVDEIYNGCDAQDYKKLKDISIFINTIGKQNCLFIFTTIDASMVYNRIRGQMNLAVLVKADSVRIFYKLIHMDSGNSSVFEVNKTPALFNDVRYDTNFIPPPFDWSMSAWNDKLKSYYSQYYDIHL